MQKTGLNTVVIDLKMDNGELAFVPNDVSLSLYAQNKPVIQDLDDLLNKLADHQIYRIARIAVMRDSTFARAKPDAALQSINGGLWQDKTHAMWLDPASLEVSTYAISLAREAYARGFDEIQFD
ncbi:MAG: putative glycoside hydrolase, partial [Patescibacteria group bacterium]